MSKRAVILAGGKGTRLRPYTITLPKPLVPIGEHPVMELIVRQLARNGFRELTVAVNHQADIIKAFFENGSRWEVEIDYSLETQPLGTVGPLRLIPDLPEHFLLMNGDVLTDLDIAGLYDAHVAADRLFTIAATPRVVDVDYGVLDESDGVLTGFREKPCIEHLVSMGVYIVSRKIVDLVPENRPFGFDMLMLQLLEQRQRVAVHRHDGYWLDIGRPGDYARAIEEFETVRGHFLV